MKTRELSDVCGERDSNPDKQGASIQRLIKAGADIHSSFVIRQPHPSGSPESL